MSESIPLHAYDLIDELDERYPEVIYDPKMDREEFMLRSGERRLVLSLKRRRQLEEESKHVYS
jgi:hypothetical protein